MNNLKNTVREMKVRMKADIKKYANAELQPLLEKITANEDGFFSLNDQLVAIEVVQDEIASRK